MSLQTGVGIPTIIPRVQFELYSLCTPECQPDSSVSYWISCFSSILVGIIFRLQITIVGNH